MRWCSGWRRAHASTALIVHLWPDDKLYFQLIAEKQKALDQATAELSALDGGVHPRGHSLSRSQRRPGVQAHRVSFQIATEYQAETNRYWNAIANGGTESQCGWCKDRWGLSWQITSRALSDALAAGGGEAKRAFEAMMTTRTRQDILIRPELRAT